MIGANGGPRSPGTAYILLHHCMGGVAGHRGLWGFVRGGMGAVSEAIAASARAKGVEIRTQRRRRARSWSASGRALRRRAGERARRSKPPRSRPISTRSSPSCSCARSAICRAGFPRPPSATSASRARPLRSISALNGLPDFKALPGAPGPQHRATMHICPSIDYVERAWDDAKYGRPSRAPAARDDHPDHVRSVARAAGPAHHGDLPAVRAVHAARGHLGRIARAVRRPGAGRDRGVRAEYPVASSSTARC